LGILAFVVISIYLIGWKLHKTKFTGSYKQAYLNKNKEKELSRDRLELQNKVKNLLANEGIDPEHYIMDKRYHDGLKALTEKYATPGSEVYKEIKKKEEEYKDKYGW
jgi:hypothetical protein